MYERCTLVYIIPVTGKVQIFIYIFACFESVSDLGLDSQSSSLSLSLGHLVKILLTVYLFKHIPALNSLL